MKIVIIGSGNVATHLGIALKAAGHVIVQVCSRNESSAKRLAKKLSSSFSTDLKKVKEADVYIVAVNDGAIKDVARDLKIRNSIVLHTSGSVSIKVFEKTFVNYG